MQKLSVLIAAQASAQQSSILCSSATTITGPLPIASTVQKRQGSKPRRQKVARPKPVPLMQDGLFDITEILGG